jgi:hypothetical protein
MIAAHQVVVSGLASKRHPIACVRLRSQVLQPSAADLVAHDRTDHVWHRDPRMRGKARISQPPGGPGPVAHKRNELSKICGSARQGCSTATSHRRATAGRRERQWVSSSRFFAFSAAAKPAPSLGPRRAGHHGRADPETGRSARPAWPPSGSFASPPASSRCGQSPPRLGLARP